MALMKADVKRKAVSKNVTQKNSKARKTKHR
jgi:hypothetical protein